MDKIALSPADVSEIAEQVARGIPKVKVSGDATVIRAADKRAPEEGAGLDGLAPDPLGALDPAHAEIIRSARAGEGPALASCVPPGELMRAFRNLSKGVK